MKIFSKTSAGTIVLALSLFACQSPKADIDTIVKDFAELECRAIELRKQRYELADQMRFAEDTLIADTSSEATKTRIATRLDNLNNGKDGIVGHGLALADTIQKRLDTLMQNELKNPDDRKKFDEALAKELEKRGCK